MSLNQLLFCIPYSPSFVNWNMPHSTKLNTTIIIYTPILREEITSSQSKQNLQFTSILYQVLSILTYSLVILHVKFPSYTLCAIFIWYKFTLQYTHTPTISNTPFHNYNILYCVLIMLPNWIFLHLLSQLT